MELTDQCILVMGGSSGIGLATARMLVEAGADVTITGRSQDKINAAVARLGERVHDSVIDATSIPQLQSFFREYGTFQHPVIAVSGAAGSGAFRTLDLQHLRHSFEAKFWPQVAIAQISLETLQHDGSITFITAGSSSCFRLLFPDFPPIIVAVFGNVQDLAHAHNRKQVAMFIDKLEFYGWGCAKMLTAFLIYPFLAVIFLSHA